MGHFVTAWKIDRKENLKQGAQVGGCCLLRDLGGRAHPEAISAGKERRRWTYEMF